MSTFTVSEAGHEGPHYRGCRIERINGNTFAHASSSMLHKADRHEGTQW